MFVNVIINMLETLVIVLNLVISHVSLNQSRADTLLGLQRNGGLEQHEHALGPGYLYRREWGTHPRIKQILFYSVFAKCCDTYMEKNKQKKTNIKHIKQELIVLWKSCATELCHNFLFLQLILQLAVLGYRMWIKFS